MEDLDPTTLADYLAIAAKLLVIKSKAILPSLEIEPEEEEAGVDLESKLILNKQFKEASKLLKLFDKGSNWTAQLPYENKFLSDLPFPQKSPWGNPAYL